MKTRPESGPRQVRLSFPVVLASASPRRQELLSKLVESFTVDPAHIDEDAMTVSDPWQTAQRLAREKALAVFERHSDSLVIAGDTVVALPREDGFDQLAKPSSERDAERMLAHLSGKTHLVITGIALRWPGGLIAFTDETRVTFKRLSLETIRSYVATGESMDKAGAYGIQGMAATLVEKIEGSLNNVVGLPTEKLEEALREVR